MDLFEHVGGEELVLTPADGPEGRRLAADDSWRRVEPVEDPAVGRVTVELDGAPKTDPDDADPGDADAETDD